MGDILYHGTHAPLFGRFSSEHLHEGSGRTKYGFGHYVTEDVGHALHYAASGATESSVLLYTVEVPALAPDNHITYKEPVDPSILARVGAALGVAIPAPAAADGLVFRKFVACRLEGAKGDSPSPEGEKAASAFFDRLGIVCAVWAYKWKQDAQGRYLPPFDRAIFNPANVRIVSVDRVDREAAAKKKKVVLETIPGDRLPR